MVWTRRAAAPRVTETVEATSGKKIRSRIWYSQEGHRLFKTRAYSSLPDVSELTGCSTHHRSLEFGRSNTSPLGSSPACSAGDRTATHKAIFVSSELITLKRAMMGRQIDEKLSSIKTLISSMCMYLFAWAATISTSTGVKMLKEMPCQIRISTSENPPSRILDIWNIPQATDSNHHRALRGTSFSLSSVTA